MTAAADRARWMRTFGACAGVLAYVLALGLVLRFCARTYPGIWVPQSSFWNAVLNGSGPFGLGYAAAMVAGLLHIAQVLRHAQHRPTPRWIATLRHLLIAACLALSAFGLWIAFTLHRLPGMANAAS